MTAKKEHVIKQRQEIAAYKITPESIYPDTYLNGNRYLKCDRKIYVARKTYIRLTDFAKLAGSLVKIYVWLLRVTALES
ncbi:MAG: hypothetical protein WBG84_12645 [Psychrobacter nivimaris]